MICQGDFTIYGSQNLSGTDVVKVALESSGPGWSKVKVTIRDREEIMSLKQNGDGAWRIDLTQKLALGAAHPSDVAGADDGKDAPDASLPESHEPSSAPVQASPSTADQETR